MAQWTNIPTDRIEPGKPIRAIDGLALRDNPIAIAEGAAGAPRVAAAALRTGNPERNWVLARTAEATAGAVGTYALVTRAGVNGSTNWNGTIAGSSLRRASVAAVAGMTYDENAALSGTWRIMGYRVATSTQSTSAAVATLALRIS